MGPDAGDLDAALVGWQGGVLLAMAAGTAGLGAPGLAASAPSSPAGFGAWRRGGVGSRRRPPALLAAAGAVALLVLLPLAWTAFEATQVDASDALDLLLRPLVGELLLNTVGLVAVTSVLAGLLGTAVAWCVERTQLRGRGAWSLLAAVPLAIPPFVTSYAWVSVSPAFEGFWGALVVVTCSYTPLVFLPVAAALRGLDPALEESGRALGLGPWRCFVRVVLPQLRPALLGGMLLVGLNVLTEFGAFTLLRFRTFTTELYAEYRTGLDGPDSSLLAVVLIVLCVACLVAERRVQRGRRYARVARFAARRAAAHPLGWLHGPVLGGLAALALATIGMPVGMVLFWLFRHDAAAVSPVVASVAGLVSATWASLWLGLAGAGLTVALALPLGVLAARHEGRLVAGLERTAYLAQGVPGIVVALALVSLTLGVAPGLYQTALLLLLAYAIQFLPLALVGVRGALLQAAPAMEEAGRSLGLGWVRVAWRVSLPLAGPGLGAAAALVFVSVTTELTATLLLAPIGTETLATQIWADTSTLAFAAAAPYAALMAGLSLLSTWVLARRFGHAALARG